MTVNYGYSTQKDGEIDDYIHGTYENTFEDVVLVNPDILRS